MAQQYFLLPPKVMFFFPTKGKMLSKIEDSDILQLFSGKQSRKLWTVAKVFDGASTSPPSSTSSHPCPDWHGESSSLSPSSSVLPQLLVVPLHSCFLLNLVFNLHTQGFLSSASIFLWMFLSSVSISYWYACPVSFPTDILVLCVHFLLVCLPCVHFIWAFFIMWSTAGRSLEATAHRGEQQGDSPADHGCVRQPGGHSAAEASGLPLPGPRGSPDESLHRLPSLEHRRPAHSLLWCTEGFGWWDFLYLLLLWWCFSLLGYSLSGTTCW